MKRLLAWCAALAIAGCSNPKPIVTATSAPTAAASRPAVTVSASPGAPSAAPTSTPTVPPIVIKGTKRGKARVEISQLSRGRVVYHLFADSSTYDSRTHMGTFQKTDGQFFEQNGKTLKVSAPSAIVNEATKSVTMIGGVHASTADGAVLTCDQLEYNDETQHVHGTGDVKLTRAGQILTGQTIDADIHLEQYRVTGS